MSKYLLKITEIKTFYDQEKRRERYYKITAEDLKQAENKAKEKIQNIRCHPWSYPLFRHPNDDMDGWYLTDDLELYQHVANFDKNVVPNFDGDCSEDSEDV